MVVPELNVKKRGTGQGGDSSVYRRDGSNIVRFTMARESETTENNNLLRFKRMASYTAAQSLGKLKRYPNRHRANPVQSSDDGPVSGVYLGTSTQWSGGK